MPDGFGEFLAIRITVKNLIVIASFFLAWALTFRAFGLSKADTRGSALERTLASD